MKLVKCRNCKTDKMYVEENESICPICGAIDYFKASFDDNCFVSEESILKVQPHIVYNPDEEGYSTQCKTCMEAENNLDSYHIDRNYLETSHPLVRELNSMYRTMANEDVQVYRSKDNNDIEFIELCATGVIENMKKLYRSSRVESIKIEKTVNFMRDYANPVNELFTVSLNLSNISKDTYTTVYKGFDEKIVGEIVEICKEWI